MQSARATLDVKGTSEDGVMAGIRRKIRMKTIYLCCKAISRCVCVLGMMISVWGGAVIREFPLLIVIFDRPVFEPCL